MTDDQLLPTEYTLRQYRAQDPNVRVFYKYQPFRSYTVPTLATQKFYLSKYEQLNDPFDLFLTHLGRNSSNTSLLGKFSDVGIFCLSESPNSQLLWSHYADSYRGLCRFDNLLRQRSRVHGYVPAARYALGRHQDGCGGDGACSHLSKINRAWPL